MTQHVPMVAASPQVIQQIGELTRMLHDTIEQLARIPRAGADPCSDHSTARNASARRGSEFRKNRCTGRRRELHIVREFSARRYRRYLEPPTQLERSGRRHRKHTVCCPHESPSERERRRRDTV